MKKFFLLFLIIFFLIIQCGNKTDSNTNDVNTVVYSNETIHATKILSKEDAAFLEKIKNKIIISGFNKYIFKDNGDIEYQYNLGSYKKKGSYIFESSKDGTNAYYYSTYNIQGMYQKAPNNIATNYEGFSVKNGVLYKDNYEGYYMDPNETIRIKWERENYYSNYYYKTVKENPNFDNFPYENKADVTFHKYNENMIGVLISEDDYKPQEVGNIQNYDFDGTYTNNNSYIELKENDDGSFYLYAINIDKDKNGNSITNIQSTDTNKMILKENQYIDSYCDRTLYGLYYTEVAEADLSYLMDIQPISRDTLIITEHNGSCGFAGVYKKSLQTVDSNDKSTKEKVYYNALKWYAENYGEINEYFNKIIDYDFEGGGYDKFNMENAYLYMSKFENTGYFSENYIKNLEYKFKDIKKELEENKQDDEENIEVMNYDWFLLTQEMDYILDMIDIMELKDIESYIHDRKEYCQYYGLSLQVKKYGNEWLIEK